MECTRMDGRQVQRLKNFLLKDFPSRARRTLHLTSAAVLHRVNVSWQTDQQKQSSRMKSLHGQECSSSICFQGDTLLGRKVKESNGNASGAFMNLASSNLAQITYPAPPQPLLKQELTNCSHLLWEVLNYRSEVLPLQCFHLCSERRMWVSSIHLEDLWVCCYRVWRRRLLYITLSETNSLRGHWGLKRRSFLCIWMKCSFWGICKGVISDQ